MSIIAIKPSIPDTNTGIIAMIHMLYDTDIRTLAKILVLYDTDIGGFIAMILMLCMVQISMGLLLCIPRIA